MAGYSAVKPKNVAFCNVLKSDTAESYMYEREVLFIAYHVHHFKSKLTLKNTANNSIKENAASKSILSNPFK